MALLAPNTTGNDFFSGFYDRQQEDYFYGMRFANVTLTAEI